MTQETIRSARWQEEPETDNAFAAHTCRCAGYDVYGELLTRASYVDYLFLLFCGERPTPAQSLLLQRLAVALANPGPRDASIHAAMSAGVGGSTRASCLMAALAVGAGQHGGARELVLALQLWSECGTNLELWRAAGHRGFKQPHFDGWGPLDHMPGFDPYGVSAPLPLRQLLEATATAAAGPNSPWLQQHRLELEAITGHPLSPIGVCAAACADLGLAAGPAEMLFLLLRLPGAAMHALEQEEHGWREFPFFNTQYHLRGEPEPSSARLEETPA